MNWFGLRRRRGGVQPHRRIIAPAVTAFVVNAPAPQAVLAACDRSPALFRLDVEPESGLVRVWLRGEVEVGNLGSSSSKSFAKLLRKANRRGDEVWVHGQVERHGVDMRVLLRCPPPEEISLVG